MDFCTNLDLAKRIIIFGAVNSRQVHKNVQAIINKKEKKQKIELQFGNSLAAPMPQHIILLDSDSERLQSWQKKKKNVLFVPIFRFSRKPLTEY